MATTLTVVPAAVEGAKALYDVTQDEINALRQLFLIGQKTLH